MDFKVLITDSALAGLREIVTFVAHDDPVAALRLGEKLISRVLRLSANPERFAFHDAERGIRKMPLPPYLVFYSCDATARLVHILHFWHGAREWPEFHDED